jgi:hypothetical protein
MNVIGFLYLSLGSSTVQLHDSLGNRCACACSQDAFSSQNVDCAWGVHYRRTVFCYAFLWAKGPSAKDIYKEMFPVHGWKCLSRKAVHNWVADVSLMMKRLKRRCGSGWDNSQNTSSGFRRTDKAMGQVYQCWRRICREINFFSQVRISHISILYPFVTYLTTVSHMLRLIRTPIRPQNAFTSILLSGLLSLLLLVTERRDRTLGTGRGTVEGLHGVAWRTEATRQVGWALQSTSLVTVLRKVPDFSSQLTQHLVMYRILYHSSLVYIVAFRAVAMQRPRDGRMYHGHFWATAR